MAFAILSMKTDLTKCSERMREQDQIVTAIASEYVIERGDTARQFPCNRQRVEGRDKLNMTSLNILSSCQFYYQPIPLNSVS